MDNMYTVAETDAFIKQAKQVWSEEERLAFITFLAQNPFAGAVVPKSGGLRKIRWSTQDKGKSGGVRVIYYNMLDDGAIICATMYPKNKTENIAAHILKTIKE